jgi:hypothetical protein
MRYNLKQRLTRLEKAICPKQDCSFTLEELCRSVWHANKKDFVKLARLTCLSLFIARFEREDAECDETDPRQRGPG